MRDRGDLRSLTDLLSSTLAGLGIEDLPTMLTILEEWSTLAGEPWAEHASPVVLRRGTLIVEASSPATVRLLGYGKQDLVLSLQKRFGPQVVTAIQVVTPGRGGAP